MEEYDKKLDLSDLVNAGQAIETDWANPPTLQDLKKDYEDASRDRETETIRVDGYLDALHCRGEHAVPKRRNRSSVQPKLIRKQAEWRYSALSEAFLKADRLFSGRPRTHLDLEIAKQNADVLNFQFENEIGIVKFINEFVRTAVDEGTVIVKTGWEYEEHTYTEAQPVYEVIPVNPDNDEDFELFQIMLERFQNGDVDPEEEPEVLRAMEFVQANNGYPHIPQIIDEEDVKVTEVIKNQPTVQICDYHRVTFDPTCEGDLSQAKFAIHEFEATYAELESSGMYENLDKINLNSQELQARPDSEYEGEKIEVNFKFRDDARKKVWVYEYWGFWDIEGNQQLRPFVATWIGDTMIRLEDSPFPHKKLPFTVVNYSPVKKSLYGQPDAPLIEDNQKIIGAITRGAIDTMAKNAAGQRGLRRNSLDSLNLRKFNNGEDFEFSPDKDPREMMYVTQFTELPNSIFTMLSWQHQDAESTSGVKAFGSSGINGSALGESVGGIKSALDATAKREVDILRRLAEGLKEIGYQIAAMNAEFLDSDKIIRITDEEFINIDPEKMKGRFDLDLEIATPEEDQLKVERLSFMLQTLGNNVDPQVTYMILGQIADLQKMPKLSKALENYQPPVDPLDQQLKLMEFKIKQAELRKILGVAQESEADAMEAISRARNLDSDTALKELEFVETESGVTHARDVDRIKAQAESNADTKMVENYLNRQQTTEEK